MARKAVHSVTDPRVWKTLVAPVRAEILETMRMLAPCSIADVARQLDRPADSLYRHFEKLVGAGAVVEMGTRPAGRRRERVFDLIADDFAARFAAAGRADANDAYLVTARTILTISSRTFRDAAAAGELVGLGLDKPCNTRAFFEHVWLTPGDFDRLNRHFRDLNDFLQSRKTRTAATRLHLVSVLAAPITRRRGADRGTPAKTPRRAAPANAPRRRSP